MLNIDCSNCTKNRCRSYCSEEYKDNHPEVIAFRQNVKRRSIYKFGTSDYNRYMREQQGKCVICEESGKKLVIDHDHETKAVRQLLCSDCNSGFGRIEENLSYMQNAVDYLLKYGQ